MEALICIHSPKKLMFKPRHEHSTFLPMFLIFHLNKKENIWNKKKSSHPQFLCPELKNNPVRGKQPVYFFFKENLVVLIVRHSFWAPDKHKLLEDLKRPKFHPDQISAISCDLNLIILEWGWGGGRIQDRRKKFLCNYGSVNKVKSFDSSPQENQCPFQLKTETIGINLWSSPPTYFLFLVSVGCLVWPSFNLIAEA